MRRYALSWFDQFWGLMLDNTPDAELEFVLAKPTRFGASIHTLFIRYPILVEWLDEDRVVVESVILKPWVLNHTPKVSAKYIIETRAD